MNARFLFVATTLSVAAAFAAMPGCTVSTNDGSPDAATSSSSSSSSGSSGNDGGLEASTTDAGDAGECLGSKERGPLCEKDETPEEPAKCSQECRVASTAFTSDIALAISTCIDNAVEDTLGADAKPTAEQCEQLAGACVAAATALACDGNDPTEFCKSVAATCPDEGGANTITHADCMQYFRGATTSGKQLLLDCLEKNKSEPKVCTACMDAIKTVHSEEQ